MVTDVSERQSEYKHIKDTLSVAGYPKWSWDMPSSRNRKTQEKEKAVKDSATLPFVQGIYEPLARRFRSHGIMTHARPVLKLRNSLVAPKDPTPTLDKSCVVYKISCTDCPSSYVGETVRPLKARVKDHQRDPSPVALHAKIRQHNVDYDNVKVLDRETNWFRRGVKEAIQIEVSEADLNRDRGRHTLPRVYRGLLHSGYKRDSPKRDSPDFPE